MTKRSESNRKRRINITTSLRLKPSPGESETRTILPDSITSFSHFFDSTKGQLHCYSNACSKTVDEFLSGRNATVFVYGQTGSGKTVRPPLTERTAVFCFLLFSWQLNRHLLSALLRLSLNPPITPPPLP